MHEKDYGRLNRDDPKPEAFEMLTEFREKSGLSVTELVNILRDSGLDIGADTILELEAGNYPQDIGKIKEEKP